MPLAVTHAQHNTPFWETIELRKVMDLPCPHRTPGGLHKAPCKCGCVQLRLCSLLTGYGSKQIVPPVNIAIPTKIPTKMGGKPTPRWYLDPRPGTYSPSSPLPLFPSPPPPRLQGNPARCTCSASMTPPLRSCSTTSSRSRRSANQSARLGHWAGGQDEGGANHRC